MTHSFKPTSITGWKDWYKYINRTNFCLIINCFAMYIYIYCGSARLIHKSKLKMKLVFNLDSLRSVLETTTAFVLVFCFLSEISFFSGPPSRWQCCCVSAGQESICTCSVIFCAALRELVNGLHTLFRFVFETQILICDDIDGVLKTHNCS